MSWGDRPVALVGSGPSLAGFDFDRLRGPWRVVAVNQKVWDLPWADACVSIDLKWIYDVGPRVVTQTTVPLIVAGPSGDKKYPPLVGATNLVRSRTSGFSDREGVIEMGCTSGYAALNWVYQKRPSMVVLFGYDYTAGDTDHDKPEQYPWHPRGHNARYWERWAKCFDETSEQLCLSGITVINASYHSAITAYPRCTVDEGVALLNKATQRLGEVNGSASYTHTHTH